MDEEKRKIVDTLNQANNILVTVRSDPSIDQLSACIALTLIVNELGKHGTAVFSGQVPSVLEFLEPEKTLEVNTDSLRDFIISLDKAKADKLRYKVEDTVVKVFITPYRTSLSPQDLEFGQGDFNVDAVVALGVHNQNDLDQAITAHGRILHDATVVSINTERGDGEEMGSVSLVDTEVSSLSELIWSLADMFDKKDLIDNQIATALLTGIVAATDRFSNGKTRPSTMETAARLLAAGANQELVATKLAEPPKPEPIPEPAPESPVVSEEAATPTEQQPAAPLPEPSNGELSIDHPYEIPTLDNGLLADQYGQPEPDEADEIEQQVSDSLQPGAEQTGQPQDSEANLDGPDHGDAADQSLSTPSKPEGDAADNPTEEQAALDFLKGRKVEYGGRTKLEPLHTTDEILKTPSIIPDRPKSEAMSPDAVDPDLLKTHYALQPPSMGGTLTANLPSASDTSTVESMVAQQKSGGPILSHFSNDTLSEPLSHDEDEPVKVSGSQDRPAEPESPPAVEPARLEAALDPQPETSSTPILPSPLSVDEPATPPASPADPEVDQHPRLDAALLPVEPLQTVPSAPVPGIATLADLEKRVHQPTGRPVEALTAVAEHPELQAALQSLPAAPSEAKDMPSPPVMALPLPVPQPSGAAQSSSPLAPPPPVPPPIPGL